MSDNQYFVMLRTQRGSITALTGSDDYEPAIFSTRERAVEEAEANPLGHAFGYTIYEVEP
jgi:hypothetical protein